jgi:hypothetical protein
VKLVNALYRERVRSVMASHVDFPFAVSLL